MLRVLVSLYASVLDALSVQPTGTGGTDRAEPVFKLHGPVQGCLVSEGDLNGHVREHFTITMPVLVWNYRTYFEWGGVHPNDCKECLTPFLYSRAPPLRHGYVGPVQIRDCAPPVTVTNHPDCI